MVLATDVPDRPGRQCRALVGYILMHHKVGKARDRDRYTPDFACDRCLHSFRLGCEMGRVNWPTAGRRCRQYEVRRPPVEGD